MSFWRKTGLVIAGILLPTLLFLWGFIFSMYQIAGTPDHIKHALQTSGIYQTFVSDILEQNKGEAGQPESQDIPTDRPEIKQIIAGAASPEFLKTQVEKFLDDTYAWIRGDSEHLRIQIDLTEVKAKLQAGLAQHATNRLNSLPVCSNSAFTIDSFDPLTAECVPKGLDKNVAVEKIKAEVDKNFKDPVITQDDIKPENGKTVEEQLKTIPMVYSKVITGLWVGIGLILLCAAGIILLSLTWRAGLKRAGITFLSVGALSAGLACLGALVLGRIVEKLGDENVQASAASALRSLAGDLRTWWLGYGIILVVLGVGMLAGYYFMQPKNYESEDEQQIKKQTSPTRITKQ